MKARKILVLSPLPEPLVKALLEAQIADEETRTGIEAVSFTGETKEELLSAVSDAYIIISDYTHNTELDEAVMEAARSCVFIQEPSTGYHEIDIDAAAARGICVSNTAGANNIPVAEHTVMMVLGCLKKVILSHDKTRAGEWAQDEMATHGVFELYQKTWGIVGAGMIGREVARRARPFECRLLYYDVVRLDEDTERELGLEYRDLDPLIEESDVISIHTPLTPETENLFDSGRIARMKPGSVLVNVARGTIVDEGALAEALAEGRIAGAGVDVFSAEPVEAGNPLLAAPNTILTPHTAGATNEARLRIIGVAMSNVAAVLRGEEPVSVVNGVRIRFDRTPG